MSLPDPHSEKSAVQTTERRKYSRHKPRQLVYVDIGENNGGFILDVSEGGVCFQGVASLNDGEIVKIRFKLPGSSTSIRTEGQFIRAGSSEKGGALKFLNIPSEVQMQLREWIALSGRPQSPSGDADVLALLSATPKESDEGVSAPTDGTRRFTSILAQALAKSSMEAEPAGIPPTDAPAATAPAAATPVQDAREHLDRSNWGEPIPPSTMASGLPAAHESTPTRPEEPKREESPALDLNSPTLFGLTMTPSARAANDSVRNMRDAVLSSAAQRNRGKGAKVSHFTAGIVVGCVVLATVGGVLVATGRLRLVQPSPTSETTVAPALPASAPAGSNVDSGAVDLGSQNQTSVPPSASDPEAAQTQAETSPASTPAATPTAPPEAPAAVAPIRNEKLTSPPQKSSVLRPTSYAEASRSSAEPARRTQPGNSLSLDMSRPVAQLPSAPVRVDAQAPALSASVAQGLPQLGSDTPAAITQTSSTASAETFASPQLEQKPTPKAPRTDTVSQRSKPVFAAPDPTGAKPSSVEPAQLVLYVEPVYPAAARSAKIQGNVDILATIGKDGVPRSLQLANGDQQLAAAAIAAISGWRYRPAMLNGQFEESLITITVKFAL